MEREGQSHVMGQHGVWGVLERVRRSLHSVSGAIWDVMGAPGLSGGQPASLAPADSCSKLPALSGATLLSSLTFGSLAVSTQGCLLLRF